MDNFFSYVENNYLSKDWIFFGILLGILFVVKFFEAKSQIKKIGRIAPAKIFQMGLLFWMYIIILIFPMGRILAGILIFLMACFLDLERAGRKFEIATIHKGIGLLSLFFCF